MRSSTLLFIGVLLALPRRTEAAPCDDLTADGQNNGIQVLWIENGDTQEPLLKRLGKQLIQKNGTKVRIIYRNRPTCELAANFYGPRNLAAVSNRPIRYIPESATFDPAKDTPPTCDAPSSPPTVMLAIGATFLSSCPSPPTPNASIAVVNGPIQAYGFIVNKSSAQVAITAEEGYLAFGFTQGTGMASPWLDQNLRFIRGTTASTTLTISANVGLQAGQMQAAAPFQTSLLLLNAVKDTTDFQATLGIVGGDLYDANRDKVKMLAFKGFGQKYAYYPDSTDGKFDKQNVRDGHYLPWSPTPYIYEVDGGAPKDPTGTVARVLDLIFGKTIEADVDGLTSVAQSGLVPQCAMKVTRDFDGGELSLYDPPEPCSCLFESCTTCTDSTPCSGGKCRRGYCEAH